VQIPRYSASFLFLGARLDLLGAQTIPLLFRPFALGDVDRGAVHTQGLPEASLLTAPREYSQRLRPSFNVILNSRSKGASLAMEGARADDIKVRSSGTIDSAIEQPAQRSGQKGIPSAPPFRARSGTLQFGGPSPTFRSAGFDGSKRWNFSLSDIASSVRVRTLY
jgi:hypothetical protein